MLIWIESIGFADCTVCVYGLECGDQGTSLPQRSPGVSREDGPLMVKSMVKAMIKVIVKVMVKVMVKVSCVESELLLLYFPQA